MACCLRNSCSTAELYRLASPWLSITTSLTTTIIPITRPSVKHFFAEIVANPNKMAELQTSKQQMVEILFPSQSISTICQKQQTKTILDFSAPDQSEPAF